MRARETRPMMIIRVQEREKSAGLLSKTRAKGRVSILLKYSSAETPSTWSGGSEVMSREKVERRGPFGSPDRYSIGVVNEVTE